MGIFEVLLQIGLLIVVAKLAEGVLGRFGLNSIVAYTATGIILGPATGIVEFTSGTFLFLETGVFILFFLIGLDEIDLRAFLSTIRGRYFVAAVMSVLISLMAALVVTSDLFDLDFALGLHFTEGLALAGILSLSSLGIVVKVLADGGHLKEPIGLKIFTTVVIAEVLALLVVGFTVGEHGHGLSWTGVLRILGQIAGFVVVAWLLSARVLSPTIGYLQRFLNVPELSFGLLFGGLFLMVVGAEEIGLHGSIGALLFGTALSGLPQRVRLDIMPGMRSASEGLFVPLFFASAGLQFDLSFLELPGATIAALVLIPLLGKFAGSFVSTYITRLEAPFALATGLMAKGVAEIALLVVMLDLGVIDQGVFSLLVLIMFGYILLMPQAITFAVKRAKLSDPPGSLPDAVPPSFARYALEGVQVGSVLDRTRSYPQPDMSVKGFADEWIVPGQHDYLVMEDGEVSGILSMTRLRFVPRGSWETTPLGNVLRLHTPYAWPEEPIDDVLERMASHSLTVIPVHDRDSGEFLGSVTSHDVLDLVVLMAEVEEELTLMSGTDTPNVPAS